MEILLDCPYFLWTIVRKHVTQGKEGSVNLIEFEQRLDRLIDKYSGIDKEESVPVNAGRE